MRYVIGIDPGKEGAIAIMDLDSSDIIKFKMPLIGNKIDTHSLSKELSRYKENSFIGVEDVHAIHGASAGATFSFGHSCGILEGIICTLSIPYVAVTPKEWQKECWQGIPEQKKSNGRVDTKKMSLLAVSRLYPVLDLKESSRCRIPHEGIVDAVLICHYTALKKIR